MHLFQLARSSNSTRARAFAVATAVLCLVLLAVLAMVQVAHVHPSASDADHCQLCIVFHALAPAAAAVIAVILVQLGSPSVALEARAAVKTWHPSLFTRPPPYGR